MILTRFCAAAQVTLIILGWALAQFPYLVEPDIINYSAAAPRATLQLLIVALAVRVLVLFSSNYYLFGIFKRDTFIGDQTANENHGRE